jgi:hypothetical protein
MTFTDPVSKMRVSTPQTLIDTDFEYSVQPSKWESLALVQNYPSFYAKGSGGVALDIVSIVGNNATKSLMTVTTSTNHGLVVGDVVSVQDSLNERADGTYLITASANATEFNYYAKGQVNGSVLDTGYTVVAAGGIFPGARIPLAVSASAMTYNGTDITVTTAAAHGLYPGTPIMISGVTATTNAPNGSWVIKTVESPTTFVFPVNVAPTGSLASGTNFANALLYTAPEGYQQHRATDGGVLITTGNNVTGVQQIRQTRRYFRYQSGKAMQFSTGAKFTPTYDIAAISASGNTITLTTIQPHNVQVGVTVLIEGIESSNGSTDSNLYNGSFTVQTVTGEKTFTYTASGVPTDTSPGGVNALVTVTAWRGASVRTGLFDEQNGFFFEFDGATLYACRRDSVKELFGLLTVTQNSGSVTGTNTKFREQLVVGEKIIIKGQSYEIAQITDDVTLRINPAYIGPNPSRPVKYLKTQNYRVPQNQWNMDKMDGSGPSGYNLQISKMQMAYIDYTWYGAGFIRFGFRAVNGDIIYCHKMPNNNVNTAAYMRSGNIPGRFEAINQGPFSRLVSGSGASRGSALNSNDTTLFIDNALNWPTAGFVMIQDSTNSELVQYTGIGAYNASVRGYPLTGLTRRTSYSVAGISTQGNFSSSAYTLSGGTANYTFTPDPGVQSSASGTAQVNVQYLHCTCAPVVSHWGVSVIMDGRYDDDKAILFTAGMNRYLRVDAGTTKPLLAIRIAPSVDFGVGKNFGVREIVNRMQLTLSGMGVYSQGQFLIQGILNPQTMTGGDLTLPSDWQTVPVGSGSLAQVVYFNGTQSYAATAVNATGAFTGGDRIFGFYTENSGGSNFSATSFNLEKVRDLGTSILSGNGDVGSVNPGYPVGPDILLIAATNLEPNGSKNLACRISWTEAQA